MGQRASEAFMILKFGKYKGSNLCDVPEDYIVFMIETTKKTLSMWEGELEQRQLAMQANESMAEQFIRTAFRELSKLHHPDLGGSNEKMREVLATKAKLESLIRR